MDAISVLKDLARRPLEAAQGLAKLDASPLNAHPGHDNSIAWLLWHAGREIDEQIASLAGGDTVWLSQGWDKKFGLNLDEHELGYGHSAERARSIVVEDAGLLFDHLSAVIDAEVAYLDSLSAEDLDEVIDSNWNPPVTRGARLISVSEDALQHVGQASYVSGIDATHLR